MLNLGKDKEEKGKMGKRSKKGKRGIILEFRSLFFILF